MFFLLPLIGLAVGAVGGVLVSHASHEKDRSSAKHHKKVADELTKQYSDLNKKYAEYSDQSKEQINDLTRQNALNEAEKDLLRLAMRLQKNLLELMYCIDNKPTYDTLLKFQQAIEVTNQVLLELNEESIDVPSKYFSRNRGRIKRSERFAASKQKNLKAAEK